MAKNIEVVGLHELSAKLKIKAAELLAAASEAVAMECDETAKDASDAAPRLTGKLASSIDGKATGTSGTVEAGVRYAQFVEHGTKNSPEQPFMEPAANKARKRFPLTARTIIGRAMGGK